MSKYPDDERLLQTLSERRNSDWQQFYNDMRSPFRLFIMKHSHCEPEQATELFQEAMIVFHRKVTRKQLQPPLKSSLKTYLFGIGKILALKKISSSEDDWDSEIPDVPIAPEVEAIEQNRQNAALVERLLQQIGEPCRQLLELFYLKGFAFDAIAETMNLPSEGAVRKRKFDCLKKIRQLIE